MTKKKGLFSRLFGSSDSKAETSPDAFVKEAEETAAPELQEAEDKAEQAALEGDESRDIADGGEELGATPSEESDDAADEAEVEAADSEPAESELIAEEIEVEEVSEEVAEDTASDVVEAEIEAEADVSDIEVTEAETLSDESSEPVQEEVQPEKKLSWFERLKRGLSRSSGALGEGIFSIFNKRKLDDDTLQDLEDILIQADLGVDTAMTITERLAENRYNKEVSAQEVQQILSEEVEAVLAPVAKPLDTAKPADGSPHVILMIGVNGAGKTTTIGKLAQKFNAEGKSVMLAAGDTFRAAAIDQLKVWGERTNSPVIAREVGADAAGLAYDAMSEAKEQGRDILMIDTAGRLQNRTELMAELEKVVRVIKKHDENAPHSVLLVLDATTGQNALNQVDIFSKTAGVSGLVMTKLDGTARGGILVAIAAKYKMPVHFIGVGEGVDDLEPFEPKEFAQAIAGLAEK